MKTAKNSKSKAFKAMASACADISLQYVELNEKKDDSTDKILSKITAAIFADVFTSYVVNNEHPDIPERPANTSGKGCVVKVKFADNRSYDYACFEEIHLGNVVYVGGSKAGKRGMIIAITDRNPPSGFYNVEKILSL